jgi:hypothetical protein
MKLDTDAIIKIWNTLAGSKTTFGYDEFVALLNRFGYGDQEKEQCHETTNIAISHPATTDENAHLVVGALLDSAMAIVERHPDIAIEEGPISKLLEHCETKPDGFLHVKYGANWALSGTSNLADRVPGEFEALVERMPQILGHKVYALHVGKTVHEELYVVPKD